MSKAIDWLDDACLDINPDQVATFLCDNGWLVNKCVDRFGLEIKVLVSPQTKQFQPNAYLLPPKDYADYKDKLIEILRHYQDMISPGLNEICEDIKTYPT